MIRVFFAALMLALTAFVSACGSTAHCRRPQDYQTAPDRAPLTGVEGLRLPESASALHIPPPVENPAPFGENAGEKWSCLDIPPRLVLPGDRPQS